MTDSQHTVAREQWKDILGFPGYQVSSFGRVRSYKNRQGQIVFGKEPRILKPARSSRGHHLRVCLSVQSKSSSVLVHQLVARAFIGDPPGGKSWVCHRDDNGHDNRVENLYWGNGRDNQLDAIRNNKRTPAKGERFPQARLSSDRVREIRRRLDSGETQASIAMRLGVAQTTISRISLGRAWMHVT